MTSPCACTTVRKANRALFRYYEEAMEGSGLTITQFAIVRALNRNGPTALTPLAQELVMERTSLYRTLRPLEDAGAVKITEAKQGRVKVATLTQRGVKMMRAAEPKWEQAQSFVVGAIGEKNWKALAASLLEIPEILETQA
ncbi:MAG: MarR family winged helix-turn-helix transcriptional regulator [Pseudomonadota bacterium]